MQLNLLPTTMLLLREEEVTKPTGKTRLKGNQFKYLNTLYYTWKACAFTKGSKDMLSCNRILE